MKEKSKNALERKVFSGYIVSIRILVIVGILLLLGSCQTTGTTVIGADTRAGLDDLAGKQTESAITAEQLIASTGEVSAGLDRLAAKAPEVLKPEIAALSGKSSESVKLASTLAGQLKAERKVTASLKESAGKDLVETARIAAEKDRAEKGELKADNQRNIAWGVCAIAGILLAAVVFLKIKRS